MSLTNPTISADADAQRGAQGEILLAAGREVALRMWKDEEPNDRKPLRRNPYETVGFVLSGRAELEVNGETQQLAPGDSWLVPADAEHTYRILERFTAIEATSPPAPLHSGRG